MNIINNIHDTVGSDILKSILDFLNRNDWIIISKWTSLSELTEEFIIAYCYKLDWVILNASSTVSNELKDVYSELIQCALMWKDIDKYSPTHSGIKCDICIDDNKSSDWKNKRNNIDKFYYNHEEGYIWGYIWCVSCWTRRNDGIFKLVTRKDRWNHSDNCGICRCVVGEDEDDQWYYHDFCNICVDCYNILCNDFKYIDNTSGNYKFGGHSEGNIVTSIINISPTEYRNIPPELSSTTLYGINEWIDLIPGVNRTPDDFGSVRQWIIFTSDTELTYGIYTNDDHIYLLVDCSKETNGRVAIGYPLYYGCYQIDIVYNSIDDYLIAYNTWKESKKNQITLTPDEQQSLDWKFGCSSELDRGDALLLTTEFSGYLIVKLEILDVVCGD